MTKQLVILGAGGHAKVCFDIAKQMRSWSNILVLDDNPQNDFFKISGSIAEYLRFKDSSDFFVAIGSNKVRSELLGKLEANDCKIATLLHPSAVISSFSTIGVGTVVMPFIVVNANATVGMGVILNTASTVDHDCRLGDFVHISPGVRIAGNVTIGTQTWIGLGTSIKNNVIIAENIIVGSSSNVISDLSDPGIYFGNPVTFYKE